MNEITICATPNCSRTFEKRRWGNRKYCEQCSLKEIAHYGQARKKEVVKVDNTKKCLICEVEYQGTHSSKYCLDCRDLYQHGRSMDSVREQRLKEIESLNQ